MSNASSYRSLETSQRGDSGTPKNDQPPWIQLSEIREMKLTPNEDDLNDSREDLEDSQTTP